MKDIGDTILIIEDDAGLTDLLIERLEGFKCPLKCFQRGEAALDWLAGQQPFLLLLDYSLPDINGKEFMAEVEKRGYVIPPFIVTTGNGDERTAVEMMKLGARDYVIKDGYFLEMLPLVVERVFNDLERESKLKLAENALAESHQFNHQIIQSAHEGMIVYDMDMNYRVWNPFMEQLTGISAEEVIGRFPTDVFPFLTEQGVMQNIEKCLKGESCQDHEFPFTIAATGKSGWASDSTAPLIDVSGKVIGVITTVRDVSERRRIEAINKSRLHLVQYSMTHTMDELLEETLNETEKLTNSLIGFYHFVEEDQQSIVAQAWSTRTKQEFCEAQPQELHYPIAKAGVWTDCINQRKPVIHNDYQSLPHRKGLPQGHVPLTRQLVVPVLRGDTIVAVLGVGNKPADYQNDDIEMVTMFADLAWEIAERKQTEKAVREREIRYRTLFERSNDAIFHVNRKTGRFMDANKSAERLTGLNLEVIKQQFFSKSTIFCTNLHSLDISNIQNTIAFGEEEIIRPDGIKRTVFFSIVPLDEDTLFIIAHDVTDLKRYADSLMTLSRLVEQSPVSIVITDVDGSIEYVNKKFCDVTGYSKEEALGLNPRVLKSEKSNETDYKLLWDTIKSGNEWSGEFCNQKKNGELYLESALISPIINEEGEIIHFVALKEDITEKKRMIADIIASKEKAEESDRLKSAFLANMSHEIRTPMNGILGFAELLKKSGITGEEHQKYIRIIEKSGHRMLNLINDLIDISKIESGIMDVTLSEINLHEMTGFLFAFFKPEAEKKGIGLSVHNGLTINAAQVQSDREKVYAILTNLVKNAIKFTREGTIEFGYSLTGNHDASEIEFFVKDTGIGVPENRQSAIFERFIQSDIPDRQAYQGAGLGLSIAKGYVEILGGKMWVKSEEGKGSAFYFTIPYIQKHADEIINTNNTTDMSGQPQNSNLKVLIVEDDETSGVLLSETIKGMCREILFAENGLEAIEACRNNQDIDLILMDIKMPGMNGFEATRQIRLFNKEVLIIAQTAFALIGDKDKMLEAGCNDYITKPINVVQLEKLAFDLLAAKNK
jgi:PAS domain S-box-containing protein